MRNLGQLTQFATDVVARGPVYAVAAYRIDSDVPLKPLENWKFWTNQSALSVWAGRSYPFESSRKSYLESMLSGDHASGIEYHYDVSNDFYALFLDNKYRFYTCAEFESENDTLEEAQEKKAEHIRSLLNLQ